MKSLVLAFALLLTPVLPARAGQASSIPQPAPQAAPEAASQPAPQVAPAPQVPEQARQRLEQIKERLALTPEQIEQVRPILAEEAQS